jgi:hypothetical protein
MAWLYLIAGVVLAVALLLWPAASTWCAVAVAVVALAWFMCPERT